jgi:hypothetical protein
MYSLHRSSWLGSSWTKVRPLRISRFISSIVIRFSTQLYAGSVLPHAGFKRRGLAFKRQDYLSHEHRKLTSQPRPHLVKKSEGCSLCSGIAICCSLNREGNSREARDDQAASKKGFEKIQAHQSMSVRQMAESTALRPIAGTLAAAIPVHRCIGSEFYRTGAGLSRWRPVTPTKNVLYCSFNIMGLRGSQWVLFLSPR